MPFSKNALGENMSRRLILLLVFISSAYKAGEC